MAEEKKRKAPKPPELFKIHSLVRDISTRVHRAKSPTRHRFNMLLGGGLIRVARKRPATVTKAILQRLMPELLDKEARGMLMVTDVIGRRLSLDTLTVIESSNPPVPTPNPPLDTAATDNKYPIGEPKPMFFGGAPESMEVETPEVMQPELPEGEEEVTEDSPVVEQTLDQPDPTVATVRKRGKRR